MPLNAETSFSKAAGFVKALAGVVHFRQVSSARRSPLAVFAGVARHKTPTQR
jgi:hypothetical protein